MALQVYKYSNYLEPAEREEFRALCKLLSNKKEDYILIANPIIEGRELDALLIKRDSIMVLEFKNYGGQLSATEFGDWHIINEDGEDIVVKGGFGGKNPYNQVKCNRWSVIDKFLKLNIPTVNAYHVAGIVVFNKKITKQQWDFSAKAQSWFHIADMTNVIEKIEDITSSKISFTDAQWKELPESLNVADYLWTDYDATTGIVENTTDATEEREQHTISITDEQEIERIIRATGFTIAHKTTEAKRDAVNVSYEDLHLSERSLDFLRNRELRTLWKHQYLAIKQAKEGHNVCVTTSTSSGKTEIFQIAAIEILEKKPTAKILAIYPMKALNRQQVERWEKTGFNVGKIDGDTEWNNRADILRNSRIIVMTPDVMHTFLLGKLNNDNIGNTICDFIKNTELVIIDELHLFKGVFGTNSAYLFRRFNHIRSLLRNSKNSFAQYITASATLPNAREHSFNITGASNFVEIGINDDASPVSEKTFYYVERSPEIDKDGKNGLITDLVYNLTEVKNAKSITFVEGRQRAGDLANKTDKQISNNEESSGIYPYRAGYERETTDIIAKKLLEGNFKGIISTSALEIGIDIDGLNVAIIADMPYDKNSYMQRIGRVGRYGCEKSYVIIVRNDNSFASQLLFDKFEFDMDKVLPNYEPALYLEDENVQNIHALCHVGDNDECEYEQWKKGISKQSKFDGTAFFPQSFIALCNNVLNGQTSQNYNFMSEQADGQPHITYTLRYFGKQYPIEASTPKEKDIIPQETITREQISTEGYRGAIRNTMLGNTFIRERVVSFQHNTIYCKKEYNNYISTTPKKRKFVIPNFNKDHRLKTIYYGDDAKIFNLKVYENCTISGYHQQENGIKKYIRYTQRNNNGEQIATPMRVPTLYTTGTVIFHPSLNEAGVQITKIAKILYETFLRRNAFDRNDINFAGGRLFFGNSVLNSGDKFIAIYDVNDSFNMTKRIVDDTLLKDLFKYLYEYKEIIAHSVCSSINGASLEAISELCQCILKNDVNDCDEDLGSERIFADGAQALYREKDVKDEEEEDDQEEENQEKGTWQPCTIVGRGNNIPNTYNILLNGQIKYGVSIDELKATENTNYIQRDYDY